MKPTVIDLFCGIGGFSKGFETAGFEVVFGVDVWDVALETFKNNHKNVDVLLADIKDITHETLKKCIEHTDVIIGGPPCQGFSVVGKRDPCDQRNLLFEDMIRIVSIIKPKIVVLENVVGLLSMTSPDGKPITDMIKKKFDEIGYNTEQKILNAADYGVPQKRMRVIFIASRIGKISYPEPTHSEDNKSTIDRFLDPNKKNLKRWITVGDALRNIPDIDKIEYSSPKSDFQKLMSNGEKTIHNHIGINHNSDVIRRMSYVPQGGNWQDIPKEYYDVGGIHSNNYRRLDPKKPAITIKHAAKSMIIHPYLDRGITVRETARLQSFSDSFILYGTKSQQHQQLANAVPPLLGYAIAKHLLSFLKKTEKKEDIQTSESKQKRGEAPEISNHKFTFIDLFAGIGGFRLAMEGLGGKCIFSSEINKAARTTYAKNFKELPKGDITKIPSSRIPNHNVLCAGFPCQAFSIGGKRKGFEDTRGTLFFDVARILKEKQPEAFFLENVRGITNHDKGKTIKIIRDTLIELGYTIFEKIMNAKDYGLPQNRDRWFCVGFRNDLGIIVFKFPDPVPLEIKVEDLLDKNVEGYKVSEIAWGHIQRHYREFLMNKKGDNLTLTNQIRPSKCVMRDDGISPCLTAKMGTGGNNVPVIVELERKLTVKECLKLMGFPDEFKIEENKMQSYKQVGNSVPLNIIKLISEKIVKSINNNQN